MLRGSGGVQARGLRQKGVSYETWGYRTREAEFLLPMWTRPPKGCLGPHNMNKL